MASKKTEKIILGSLMKNPLLLAQSEKYLLTVDDFSDKLSQHLFYAIASIANDGSKLIKTQDVHLYLENSPTGIALFNSQNGITLLNDAIQLANEESFNTYYNLMKKENLLRDLKRMGFDTKEFYEINPLTQEEVKINDKYNDLELKDIMDIVRMKVLNIEKEYLRNDATETRRASDGIREMLASLEEAPEVGPPLQGDIFNTISDGARKGVFYVRSGGSGTSKTRQAVGDACYLAYPVRYNKSTCQWEQVGSNEKALVIATEQNEKEIRLMILAYLSGINERKFRHSNFTKEEKEIVMQAVAVMEMFEDNMFITRMPNPTIESVRSIVRENFLLHQVEYVFYDYIFIGPSLLYEFKGFNLRNDEVLLMFSTALKDLSVELDIFIMSSTQANGKADDNKEIRGENTIAGSRAIINKADLGCMMSRPTKEELETLKDLIAAGNAIEPNIVTDIFKARAGEWTQVRIWSYVDLGSLRKTDLFITDSRLEPVADYSNSYFNYNVELADEMQDLLVKLNK